jgi:hypothetical protein
MAFHVTGGLVVREDHHNRTMDLLSYVMKGHLPASAFATSPEPSSAGDPAADLPPPPKNPYASKITNVWKKVMNHLFFMMFPGDSCDAEIISPPDGRNKTTKFHALRQVTVIQEIVM